MKNQEISREFVRVLDLEGQALMRCAKRMSESDFRDNIVRVTETFQKSLDQGGKIIITGVGKSGKVAQKIAATFSSTGTIAIFLHPTEGLHGDLGVVQPKDVVFALSYSGNTDELLKLLPTLKKRGIPVVGMGGNPRSRLAENCDLWIDGSVEHEACPYNLAPTTSTTLAMAIGDALAVTLMKLRGFDEKAFAENHPGGSLGLRLTLQVKDLMHHGRAVATLSADASVEEVVIQSTEKKLGGVLVVEGTKLIGLITDGDLRRALKHREKFFALKASEIMTTKPTTVRPDELASDALAKMENRESQISVLPVTDSDGNWKGLIRLHDLIQRL